MCMHSYPSEKSNQPTGVRRNTPLFSLGHVIATREVLTHLERHGVNAQEYLARHVRGDWGEVPSTDAVENDFSVRSGFRILSSYTIAGKKVWVITEADRSVTTLLFPSQY